MTGQAIIVAILAGERNPHALAGFRDWRVKASEEHIARSLEGNWQEDQRFVLKQEQDSYEFGQKQIAQCDQLLQQYLQQQEDRSHVASLQEGESLPYSQEMVYLAGRPYHKKAERCRCRGAVLEALRRQFSSLFWIVINSTSESPGVRANALTDSRIVSNPLESATGLILRESLLWLSLCAS